MADFEMVTAVESYLQGFNHYHRDIGEIVEHMEQMGIGLDAIDSRPSDDEDQRAWAIRSNNTAVCNRAEGQSSDESNASQQHSKYGSADECGRSERNIESCSNDRSSRRVQH